MNELTNTNNWHLFDPENGPFPDDDTCVIAATDDGETYPAHHDSALGKWFALDGPRLSRPVTHWSHIPPHPCEP